MFQHGKRNKEYYLLLSQDHPGLSLTEATIIVRRLGGDAAILHSEPGLVVIEAEDNIKLPAPRLSFIKEFGLVIRRASLGEGYPQIYREISITARMLRSRCGDKIGMRMRIYNLGRKRVELDYESLVRLLKKEISYFQSTVEQEGSKDLSCDITIIIGNILVIALPIARRTSIDRKSTAGYMKNIEAAFLAGAAINLRDPRGAIYDPFGGYGKILEEICGHETSSIVIGSDIDARKVLYMKRSLDTSGRPCLSDVIVADALNPPIRPNSVGLVVSDLPYGRRSRSIGEDYLELPVKFLQSARGILKRGSGLMISISLEQLRLSRIFLLGDSGYKILSAVPQYVHGSLARVYLLLLRE